MAEAMRRARRLKDKRAFHQIINHDVAKRIAKNHIFLAAKGVRRDLHVQRKET